MTNVNRRSDRIVICLFIIFGVIIYTRLLSDISNLFSNDNKKLTILQ